MYDQKYYNREYFKALFLYKLFLPVILVGIVYFSGNFFFGLEHKNALFMGVKILLIIMGLLGVGEAFMRKFFEPYFVSRLKKLEDRKNNTDKELLRSNIVVGDLIYIRDYIKDPNKTIADMKKFPVVQFFIAVLLIIIGIFFKF